MDLFFDSTCFRVVVFLRIRGRKISFRIFGNLYNGLGTVVPNILIVPAVPRVRQLSPTKHLLAKICAHILGQIKSQMIL